jgi:membrane protein
LFLFAAYTLVPNSIVAFRPAVAGAAVAALLVEIGKQSLGAYLQGAFSINQLYGSLGLIPLFMFWVYLMWLAVLFGLQVSATHQMLHGRTLDEIDQQRESTGMLDPTSVLNVMEVVAERFLLGKVVTAREVTDATGISERVIARILQRLVQEGWLNIVERPEISFSLAKPPDQVGADDLIELGYRMVDEASHGRRSALCTCLRDGQKSLAGGISLASLVRATPPDPSRDAG